jgi:hypothetical protein
VVLHFVFDAWLYHESGRLFSSMKAITCASSC